MVSLAQRIQRAFLRRHRQDQRDQQLADPGVSVTRGCPPDAGGAEIQCQSPVTLYEIRPTGGAEAHRQNPLTLHDKKPASKTEIQEIQRQPLTTLYEIRPTSGAEGQRQVPLTLNNQKPVSETENQRRTLLTLRYQENNSKTETPLQRHLHRDQEPSIDPLIAVQIQNMKDSRLVRLPEELLLCILDSIGDDAVALFCLRRVSRKLRRIINTPRIWKRTRLSLSHRKLKTETDSPVLLSFDETQQMERHLQHDGMCGECKLSCDASAEEWSIRVRQLSLQYSLSDKLRSTCRFQSLSTDRLNCHACGTSHNVGSFAPVYQDPSDEGYRRCLGRQGAVQLCEHVHVSWDGIESHMSEWRTRRSGGWDEEDWKACMDDFRIECRDPSHDGLCTVEDGPVWPRARLQNAAFEPRMVVLSLEWSHHSRLDALAYNPGGQVRASDIRKLIKGCRESTGGILFSPAHPDSLPEMACYDSSKCRCLYYHYQMNDDEIPGTKTSQSHHCPPLSRTFLECGYGHRISRGWFDRWTESVRATSHGAGGAYPSCLVMHYQRRVFLFKKEDRGTKKMNPDHAWFHAMDPDTYPRPSSLCLPLCRRKGRMNYYRRPKVFRCEIMELHSIHE